MLSLVDIRYVCRWKNEVGSTNKKKIEEERRYQQMWRDPTDPFLENFPFIQTIYCVYNKLLLVRLPLFAFCTERKGLCDILCCECLI